MTWGTPRSIAGAAMREALSIAAEHVLYRRTVEGYSYRRIAAEVGYEPIESVETMYDAVWAIACIWLGLSAQEIRKKKAAEIRKKIGQWRQHLTEAA